MTQLLVEASGKAPLDAMLECACERLQLTDTQLAQGEEHYDAVGDWLGDEDSGLHPFSPAIRPQGSVLQGTVVKPIGRDDYDIDLVCLLNLRNIPNLLPRTVYELVAGRLGENAAYKDKLVRSARCLTLKYAGDFCLDILPALPSDAPFPGSIKIPDRALDQWVNSNPFGFAEWFRQQSQKRNARKSLVLLEAAKDVAPLPTEQIAARPLQRAVQLFKRRRDVIYGTREDRPSSMVITSLAGVHYQGDWPTSDALIGILVGLDAAVNRAPFGTFRVPNPSDAAEDLVGGWTPEQHRKFRAFVADFRGKMVALLKVRGLDQIGRALADLFGEKLAEDVIRTHLMKFKAAHESDLLKIGKGSTILTGPLVSGHEHRVPRNTFYGA